MTTVWWHDDRVRWVTFNGPETLDALDHEEFAAGAPDSVRAIVFRGAGNWAFSVGAAVDGFRPLWPTTARSLVVDLERFLTAVRTAPDQTICAIPGYYPGAALERALAADLHGATEHSAFGLPEIALGVATVRDAALPRRYIGLNLARKIILAGALYLVVAYRATSLVNRVVPVADFDATVGRLVHAVSDHSAVAIRG